jgi:signal transduction histidine kinase
LLFRKNQQYDSAFYFQDVFHLLQDSLLNLDARRHMDSLRIRYETTEKEKQIIAQSLEIQTKTHQRNLLFIGTLLLLLMGSFIVFYFWNRNRLNKQLAAQTVEISEQQIAKLEQEKQLMAMHAMIEGQEAERTRIARDLHDGLGALLSNVKAHFSVIQERMNQPEDLSLYEKVNSLIDTASKSVRRISHNMVPHALRFSGLKDALEDLVMQLRKDGLQVQFNWTGSEEPLPQNMEIMLYRIAQELTNNVVKHAAAENLLIQVNRFDHDLTITIEDDGKGFDPLKLSEGIGLQNVRSRIAYLDGKMDMDTVVGAGTTITILVPLKEDMDQKDIS